MQLTDKPTQLPLPFAATGGRSSIPAASQIGITAGAASLADGFPPLTRTPIAAGGVPPSGLDMNGILYEMSAVDRWANMGGGYPYDSTYATAIGGYPKGARVLRADGLGYWLNIADNNTTDPDAGGANWRPDLMPGASAVTMTGSNVTLTAPQYGQPVIRITGLLTADLNLIFPAISAQWTVINATTGAYTVTAKTASGTGVPVTGAQAIVGDGANILAVTPVLNNDVGIIAWFARSTAPTGYLKANGAAISRAAYSSLFAAIGTTFGAGDGVSTFNLPDLRGEFIRGWDDSRGVDSGRIIGSAQTDEIKSHTHRLQYASSTSAGGSYIVGSTAASGMSSDAVEYTGGTETRPRNIALLACIKYIGSSVADFIAPPPVAPEA